MSWHERDSNLWIDAECSNHLSYQGHTFAVPYLNTGLGGIDIFELKLTFEMLTVQGQQRSFLHTNRCCCESFKVFETENVSTWARHPGIDWLTTCLFGDYCPCSCHHCGMKNLWTCQRLEISWHDIYFTIITLTLHHECWWPKSCIPTSSNFFTIYAINVGQKLKDTLKNQ